MNRKIMLTVLISFLLLLNACNGDVEEDFFCEEGDVLIGDECTNNPDDCRIDENDLACYEIVDNVCKEVEFVCDEGYQYEDCECIDIDTNDYWRFEYDGESREYLIHLPNNLEDDAPLLFSLHGFTSNPKAHQLLTHFDDISDREGFVVVYPYGTLVDGVSHWNAKLEYSTADDLGFLVALAEYLQDEYNLNENETFITGFSNGGFMSYEAICQANDTFRAAAPVSGLMSQETFDTCQGNPAPILHIHGAVDRVVPIDGLMNGVSGGWAGPSLDDIITYWNNVNGNSLVNDFNEGTTGIDKYYNESDTNYVWFYNVTDYDHIWPGSIDYYSPIDTETAGFDASEVIWEFFSQYVE